MSTVEVAAIGLMLCLVLAAVTRRLSSAWRRVPPLAVLALFFAVCAPVYSYRQAVVIVLAALWSVRHVQLCRKHGLDRRPDAPSGGPAALAAALLRHAGVLFLSAAPLLVAIVEAEAAWSSSWSWSWSWAEAAGVLMFGAGLYLTYTRRVRHLHGEMLMACSFYVLALAVDNGLPTLFAPILLVRYLERLYAGAPATKEFSGAYGLSVTPDR